MGMFSQLAQGVDWSSLGAMALRVVGENTIAVSAGPVISICTRLISTAG